MEKGNRQRAILAGLALALVVGMLAFAQGPPTQVPDAMVQAPVTSFTAIRVLTPQGWVLAQPDSTIQIDTAATPPVIRAVVPSARTEARQTFLVAAPTQTFQLTAAPAAGTSVKVYANGLLMAETYDYAIDGQTVTFVAGQPITAGYIVSILYWR